MSAESQSWSRARCVRRAHCARSVRGTKESETVSTRGGDGECGHSEDRSGVVISNKPSDQTH